ncbi:MAG: hypothetical protein Q4A74_05015 [Cardiobacteriaceae bacterium]|nr:hypothetical protein [Cardiobacteriaceae bacterium]
MSTYVSTRVECEAIEALSLLRSFDLILPHPENMDFSAWREWSLKLDEIISIRISEEEKMWNLNKVFSSFKNFRYFKTDLHWYFFIP